MHFCFKPHLLQLFLLLFFHSSIAQTSTNEEAFIIFRNYLHAAEDYAACRSLNPNEDQGFQEKIIALEKLTGIASYDDGSCWTNYTRIPVTYNIVDWHQWFQLNKAQLILDEEKGILKTANAPIPINKNPQTYFLHLLSDMEEMFANDDFTISKFYYIIITLDAVTDFRKTHHRLRCSCVETEQSVAFVSPHHITIIKEWYTNNAHKLYWDTEEQRLGVTP